MFSNLKKKNIYSLECNFCESKINNNNPYIFHVYGLGKYNQKYICQNCLISKLK